MVLERNVGRRDRLVRGALAAAFAVLAVWTFGRGETVVAAAASAGAVALGVNAVTCFCGVNRLLGIDTTEG